MKKLRRLAAMAAVFCLCGCMTACGSSEEKTSIPEITIEPISIELVTEGITTTQPETAQKPTEAPTEAPEILFTRGTVSGNTYTSTFANFKFSQPAGWTFASDEQIMETMANAAEYFGSTEELNKYMDEGGLITDARSDCTQGGTISFSFMRSKSDAYRTVENIVEMTKNSIASEDYSSDITETRSFKIGNDEYLYFTYVMSVNGASVYQTNAMKKMGEYFFYISYASANNDFESIIPYFDCITGSTKNPDAIRMNSGMLEVDRSLFGLSKNEAEAKLGVSLGAPEDFPYYNVHQNLYYYQNGGYTYNIFFTDNNELDIISVDELKGFDNSVFDRYKATYGEPTLDDYVNVFDLGNGLTVNVYAEDYTETDETYFRQEYKDYNYYH